MATWILATIPVEMMVWLKPNTSTIPLAGFITTDLTAASEAGPVEAETRVQAAGTSSVNCKARKPCGPGAETHGHSDGESGGSRRASDDQEGIDNRRHRLRRPGP